MEGASKLILVLHNRADGWVGARVVLSWKNIYLATFPLQHFCYKLDQIVRESRWRLSTKVAYFG